MLIRPAGDAAAALEPAGAEFSGEAGRSPLPRRGAGGDLLRHGRRADQQEQEKPHPAMMQRQM
jgi:hypothetical protein